MNRIVILYLFLSLCTFAFAQAPPNANSCFKKAAVSNGPEDMVLDEMTDASQPRLLIACSSRRKAEQQLDQFISYDINTGLAKSLKRIEPAGLCMHWHGIDLVKVKDSIILLAIAHCDEKKQHSVFRYLVRGDELIFINKITDPLFRSPNAVAGFPDGSFLVSNDAGKRHNNWEMIFKMKKSKVIYCKNGLCTIAADHVCFGNGITIDKDTVYQASTLPGEIYKYQFKDGKLINKVTLAKIKGADNIRIHGDKLVVAGHLKFGKFIKHMKHSEKRSPSTIYTVNKVTGAVMQVYANDGEQISAASTGIIFDGRLYISQVFDSFILDIDMNCLRR